MHNRLLLAGSVLLLLAACGGSEEGDSSGGSGWFEKKAPRIVYEDQDRNGPCWDNKSCLDGLRCKDATKETPGVCTFDCESDSDCGNGYLCRSSACQKDCAEVGEKCSPRRECCFYDANGNNNNDARCKEAPEGGDVRCRIEDGAVPSEPEVNEEEEAEAAEDVVEDDKEEVEDEAGEGEADDEASEEATPSAEDDSEAADTTTE